MEDGYTIQERIKKSPLDISQISSILTNNPNKIRLSKRDPIPKKYIAQLSELLGFVEYWVSKNQIKIEEMELEIDSKEKQNAATKEFLKEKYKSANFDTENKKVKLVEKPAKADKSADKEE